jgi:hypothetical protein
MRFCSLILLVLTITTSPLFALQPNPPSGSLLPGGVVQTRFGPMDAIVQAPRPIVPAGHYVQSRGVYAVEVALVTGWVPAVRVLESCGDPVVDNVVLQTLQQWRFRPRTIYKLIVPIEFAGSHAILGGR